MASLGGRTAAVDAAALDQHERVHPSARHLDRRRRAQLAHLRFVRVFRRAVPELAVVVEPP